VNLKLGELRANLRLTRFALYTQQTLLRLEVRRAANGGTLSAETTARAKTRVCSDVLQILGVSVTRSGERVRKSSRGQLIVANHRTALDIGVLMSELGGAFLSRSDVADWPIAGRLARYAGTIFVDRADKRSGARAIRSIRRRLKEGGTVIVFPEGTTYAGDEVRPFKGGAFAALRGLDVDILPVGLAYPQGTEFVTPGFVTHIRGIAARPTTPMHLCVGEAFRAEGNARHTSSQVRDIVHHLVINARATLKRETE
jgi:1-acyl-sn-glycerol-3-phosphate acyltransferase